MARATRGSGRSSSETSRRESDSGPKSGAGEICSRWVAPVGVRKLDNFYKFFNLVVHGVMDAHAVGDQERRVGLGDIEDLHHLDLRIS